MSIMSFACGECGKALNIDEQFAGRSGRCPQCRAPFTVPKSGPIGAELLIPDLPAPQETSGSPPSELGAPVTWRMVLKVWWAYCWRYLALAVGVWIALAVALVACFGSSEANDPPAWAGVLFFLIVFGFSVPPVTSIINKDFGGFKLILISKQEQIVRPRPIKFSALFEPINPRWLQIAFLAIDIVLAVALIGAVLSDLVMR
jgi:hypothetical protein